MRDLNGRLGQLTTDTRIPRISCPWFGPSGAGRLPLRPLFLPCRARLPILVAFDSIDEAHLISGREDWLVLIGRDT